MLSDTESLQKPAAFEPSLRNFPPLGYGFAHLFPTVLEAVLGVANALP